MKEVTIYYNPRCGTCQKAKAIAEAKGYAVRLIEYLKTPPSEQELDTLLKKLGVKPVELARQKEPIYQETVGGRTLTRAQWLKILHENPILIERPIIVKGDRAIIARPAEKAESFL